jgi:hypothetical protein
MSCSMSTRSDRPGRPESGSEVLREYGLIIEIADIVFGYHMRDMGQRKKGRENSED